MFEFKLSYKELEYHKEGDLPFTFPPPSVDSVVDANLIDMEGINGSGKTTLLNVLALALGYLDNKKELDKKPMLRNTLQELEENETLEYTFCIRCNEPQKTELKIERKKGQKQKCWLNSKSIGPEKLASEFDLVFLTEDDPKKVVTASLGKLSKYFNDLDKQLADVSMAINKHMLEIEEYRNFENNKRSLLEEIKFHEGEIESNGTNITELQQKLEMVELKEDIKKDLELLRNKEKITSEYNNLNNKYEQVKSKDQSKILSDLKKNRTKLDKADEELEENSTRIRMTCNSLMSYGVNISSDRLLNYDHSEFKSIMEKMQPDREERAKIAIVDEMIGVMQHYSDEDIVPLVDKTVRETLSELYKIKTRLSFDRVTALLHELEKELYGREKAIVNYNKIHEKINTLKEKIKDLGNLKDIEKAWMEIQEKYLQLQSALQKDKTQMLSQWNEVSSIEGDPESIKSEMQELQAKKIVAEKMKSKCEESLRILEKNSSGKPKYNGKESKLQLLNKTITAMRENLSKWIAILQNRTENKKQFLKSKEKTGFDIDDYNKFIKAAGEFLGGQFEPVTYDYKLHNIKFFDIENDAFITKEDRRIPISRLSQGQSKITALTGSFKEMNQDRKKIVLIDEIADLDPVNLQNVKNMLKKNFDSGSILLAVLVRPKHYNSSRIVEIKGWG